MKDKEKTLIAVRLNKSKTEILWLVLLLGIFGVLLAILGGIQYALCLDKSPDMTMAECFRGVRK